ncbi:hypothetical protein FRC02_010765 [Tulasnella sp. 418]|nr:hypothetical protein FRC02_010765 [Tulasnella sp. 418]
MWFNNSVAYIPDSARQIIIKWSLGPYAPSISIIRPLFALSRYRDLVFHISDDGAWWAIGARTEDGSGVAEGTLQVHSEKSNKDRILKGLTCCLATVDVYDKQKVLLLRAGSDNDKLWLKVEQLETVAHEQRFQPVEVSIEMLTLKDFPRTIRVLDGLPIIAINTNKRDLYFFELHTGAHLFSRSYHKGFFIWKRSDEGRSILMEADNGKQIVRVSVNELDLIGYVRQVLCDETLASSIAIRARLPGAEDVLFNDMHR